MFRIANPHPKHAIRRTMNTHQAPVLPPATLGILGAGQLGRMSAMAARALGFRVRTFDPSETACAAGIADHHTAAGYDDAEALRRFASACDRVTLEFENIPPAALETILASGVTVNPSPRVLSVCQNRRREKEFLGSQGIPCAPFRVVDSPAALKAAVAELGAPAVLKTADFGYDGKGQVKIPSRDTDLDAVWERLAAPVGVLEAWIPFTLEISVIVARTATGETAVYPACENIHANHILHLTITPARVSAEVEARARALAVRVAEALDVVGLLAVELFVLADGSVLVNEMAPRPHNSGHHTINAAVTSQFEQHVRAVCGLPLGDTRFMKPAVMLNLLGDLWPAGGTPDWTRVLRDPGAKLHLYDKGRPAPGRKMGHITVVADTVEDALARARAIDAALRA